MIKTKAQIIDASVAHEGGFSDDPADSGGATMYGIAFNFNVRELARIGITSPAQMSGLTRTQAIQIYQIKYWDGMSLDQIYTLSPLLAERLFEFGINGGMGSAGEALQVALNSLNDQGKHWPDLVEDGGIGPRTVAAATAMKRVRGEQGMQVLNYAVMCLQGARYIELSRKRQKDERFMFGWLSRLFSGIMGA